MNRLASLGLALVIALMLVAPLATAQTAYFIVDIDPQVQTYNTTISVPVVNQTLVMAANTSQTINVNLTDPGNWDYMIVMIDGSSTVSLSATYNGSSVFSGQVTPLSTGPTTVTMPIADTITLSVSQEFNGSIIVYVVADVQFQVSIGKQELYLAPGAKGSIPVTVTQVAGPSVYTWWQAETNNAPMTVWVDTSDGQSWYYSGGIYYTQKTTGAGWSMAGNVVVAVRPDAQPGTFQITLYLYASDIDPNNVVRPPDYPTLVATVDLAGTLSVAESLFTPPEGIDEAKLGIAILVIIFIMILVAKGNRRGFATPGAVLILLLLVATIGIAFGLIDVKTEFNVDPAMLGIGILALVAILILVRQGAVPAPKVVRKLLR